MTQFIPFSLWRSHFGFGSIRIALFFLSLSLFLDLVFIDTENNYSCKHKILRTHKMVQCLTQCTDSNIVNRELNRLIILKLNGYESCIVDRYALSRLHTSSYKYNTYLTLTSNRYTANAIENGTEREREGVSVREMGG